MASQFFQCPRCKSQVSTGSQFCNKCGLAFSQDLNQTNLNQTKKKTPNWAIALICLGAVMASCVFCGIIGNISDKLKPNKTETTANTNVANQTNSTVQATPTPTPPPTFAELKIKAQPLLKMPDKTEYSTEQLKPFDEVIKGLREIPKQAKEYKEAQNLFNQLNKKLSVFLAEIFILGQKPTNSAYDGNVAPAQEYLKQALNDYSSSEYLGWTVVQKTYIGKEPYWTTTVRIRAKNGFGAFVVNEYKFLIRNNQVVKVER